MTTLKLDTDGNLAIENNSLVLLSDPVEETAQRLRRKLRTFYGECVLERRAGVPYYERVLVKDPDLGAIRSMFREIILGDENVASIETLTLDHNRSARSLSMSFEATLSDGSVLSFADFVLGANL